MKGLRFGCGVSELSKITPCFEDNEGLKLPFTEMGKTGSGTVLR